MIIWDEYVLNKPSIKIHTYYISYPPDDLGVLFMRDHNSHHCWYGYYSWFPVYWGSKASGYR